MKKKIIHPITIIGAGLGGISLAIRLQSAGIPTVILEQHSNAGGRAYVYKDKGFTFDAGPTVITDPSLIQDLFYLSGKRLSDYIELLPVQPLYRLCWKSGEIFDYFNNQIQLENQIKKFNECDVQGYNKFLKYSYEVFQYGYLKLSNVPFLSFWDMLRVTPKLIQLRSWKSVYDIVSQYIKNTHLRQAFSFHSLLIGGNPFSSSSIYTLIHALEREYGVWFPRGGIGVLIKSMVDLFISLGGKILFNTKVKHLFIMKDKITSLLLENNEVIETQVVASNADIVYTYNSLLKNHSESKKIGQKLKNKIMSNSLFIIYFGLNFRHILAHHTILLNIRYKDLIHGIFYKDGLSEDFALYLHSPCITDDSLAPIGCSSHYVLAPVPNLKIAKLHWSVEGLRFCNIIFDYLEKYYMPGLRSQLVTYKIFTPIGFYEKFNSYQGSAFSIAPILTQSAWFRPKNRDDNINNLYLVGAGTHPGAGIPGVIKSSKITADLILKDIT